jgi:hypothetical protein
MISRPPKLHSCSRHVTQLIYERAKQAHRERSKMALPPRHPLMSSSRSTAPWLSLYSRLSHLVVRSDW